MIDQRDERDRADALGAMFVLERNPLGIRLLP
jgi:hypothetical protein